VRDSNGGGVFKGVNKQRQQPQQTKKDKTMKKTILLAVAAAGMFTFAASTQAGEPLLSPRAQSNQIRVVAGTSVNDVNLATNRPVGNAKAWELAQSLKRVPSTGNNVDLAHAPRPTMSPKDSRYETALRENATKQFQVAPLK
jgi:endo-alpha-1,4-polygalactosaminidase (GH114 family)